MEQWKNRVVIIGGGAAGFFAAITCKAANPGLEVVILEKGKQVLQKVRISGGGRCNVTHACFDPLELVKFYPRGGKALLGPFHRFQPGDTMEWFAERGVETKVEADNRVFPVTDRSQSIVDCLFKAADETGISVITRCGMTRLEPSKKGGWNIYTAQKTWRAGQVVLASGSSPVVWKMLAELGLKTINPVPSLFTFNIKDLRLEGLPGIAVPTVVKAPTLGLEEYGPTLITHWGLSGPGILKLSAWGARPMHECQYRFPIHINWLPDENRERIHSRINDLRRTEGKRWVQKQPAVELPTRLWQRLAAFAGIPADRKWGDLRKNETRALIGVLTDSVFEVNGKSTFKDEFVTCGGVALDEINFKSMECHRFPGLYLAGEVLNIDAVTGGFNFQAAWTEGWIAGKAIAAAVS